MIHSRSATRRTVAALLASCVVACPLGAATQPYGGGTPEELVARMRSAAAAGDMGELMACMAPEDRKAVGSAMLMTAVMMVGFSQMATDMGSAMAEGMSEALGGEEPTAEQAAELAAQKAEAAAAAEKLAADLRTTLEPHGLAGLLDPELVPGSPQDQALDAALDKADMIALTESVMGLLDRMKDAEGGAEAEGDSGLEISEAGAPAWLETEVTDYVVEGDRATARAGDETLRMIRVDGRWYFEPEPQTEPETPVSQDAPPDGL